MVGVKFEVDIMLGVDIIRFSGCGMLYLIEHYIYMTRKISLNMAKISAQQAWGLAADLRGGK